MVKIVVMVVIKAAIKFPGSVLVCVSVFVVRLHCDFLIMSQNKMHTNRHRVHITI